MTGYGLTESGSQTFSSSDASYGTLPGTLSLESPSGVAYGYILGLQFTPSQSIKVGLTYANSPSTKDVTVASGSLGAAQFRTNTFIPARLGGGITYSPDMRLSLAADVVYVFSSKVRDTIDFANLGNFGPSATDSSQWSAGDHFELRLGGEYAAVQTRTNILLVRAGIWAETASNLKYAGSATINSYRAQNDFLATIFPNTDDATAFHVTGGVGVMLQKTWQVDLGFDYETNLDKKFVASLLLGYTF